MKKLTEKQINEVGLITLANSIKNPELIKPKLVKPIKETDPTPNMVKHMLKAIG